MKDRIRDALSITLMIAVAAPILALLAGLTVRAFHWAVG